MFQLDLKQIVSTLAPCLLGDNWKQFGRDGRNSVKKCVYFRFDCSINDYVLDKQHRKVIHIVVTQHHECFYAITDLKFSVKPEEFKFSSAHDSCWNEMSFVSQAYFDFCKEVNDDAVPRDLNMHCWMEEPIVCHCVTEQDKDANNGYTRKFVRFERVEA